MTVAVAPAATVQAVFEEVVVVVVEEVSATAAACGAASLAAWAAWAASALVGGSDPKRLMVGFGGAGSLWL